MSGTASGGGQPDSTQGSSAATSPIAGPWPVGAEILELEMVAAVPAGIQVWAYFADLDQGKAVVRRRAIAIQDSDFHESPGKLVILSVATSPEESLDAIERLASWLDETSTSLGAGVPFALPRSVLLTLHGARLLWRPGRIAVFASAERLPTILPAIVEASVRESELRSLEQEIDTRWGQVGSDSALAFSFGERDVRRRTELSQRFQELVALRTRLVRLTPHIEVPHVFPPTLASQIAERLRERTRMSERLELLEGKLEAQERVYELCGQRASEFMLARTGHHLEWAIILLLLTQTALLVIELMSSGKTT
ncbi:MAG: hypothetical protein U1A77_17380 [Pirellulales bacterium]